MDRNHWHKPHGACAAAPQANMRQKSKAALLDCGPILPCPRATPRWRLVASVTRLQEAIVEPWSKHRMDACIITGNYTLKRCSRRASSA